MAGFLISRHRPHLEIPYDTGVFVFDKAELIVMDTIPAHFTVISRIRTDRTKHSLHYPVPVILPALYGHPDIHAAGYSLRGKDHRGMYCCVLF